MRVQTGRQLVKMVGAVLRSICTRTQMAFLSNSGFADAANPVVDPCPRILFYSANVP